MSESYGSGSYVPPATELGGPRFANPGQPATAEVAVNPLRAARHHPLVFLVPVIVLIAVAAALGLVKKPVYTAQAQISVGRLDVSAQAIPGYVQASTELAGTYARVVDATAVVDPVAQRLHLSPSDVASRVSASPLAGAQIIVVQATGSSRAQTVALVNAATASLTSYIHNLNAYSRQTESLLTRYRASLSALQHDQNQLRRAQRRVGPVPTAAQSSAVDAAQTRVNIAQLQVNTLGGEYQSAASSEPDNTSAQVLAGAATASSNRSHTLELLLLSGAIAGIVLGLALATWRDARRPRRI